jgi:hypothetical protein
MLLEHEEPYTIIKSSQIGIMQHDPYSWQILGPNFLRVEELTADSRFLDRTFKSWLSQMTNEERSAFLTRSLSFWNPPAPSAPASSSAPRTSVPT